MPSDSFLNKIDTSKVDSIMKETSINVQYFNTTCASIISKYSESLDNLMKDLYIDCVKNENPTMDTLEKYYLELSNLIYFMNEQLEQLGIQADMAEKANEEVYAKGYIRASEIRDENGKKKPVDEIKALANTESQYESVVASIYDHAYKVVKGKIASGQSMMDTLRRIISTRTEMMKVDNYHGGNV